MCPSATRIGCKMKGRPQVTGMTGGCAGEWVSMFRCPYRASDDVEQALQASVQQADTTPTRHRVCVDDGDGVSSCHFLHHRSRGTSETHWLPRRPVVSLRLSSSSTSCATTDGHLRLSRQASKPQPATLLVPYTYPRQCEAGWPSCYDHVEVMFPGWTWCVAHDTKLLGVRNFNTARV